MGISAFYHDSAACLLKNGEIIAAAQEERFTRKKHDPSYPRNAINFVLEFANHTNLEEDRVEKFGIKLQPWKTDGQFITIATQRPDSHQWSSMPTVEVYLRNAIGKIREYSSRDIVIRPHPRDRITNFHGVAAEFKDVFFDVPRNTGIDDNFNFGDILDRSWCVVNHSSNPAIEAVINSRCWLLPE